MKNFTNPVLCAGLHKTNKNCLWRVQGPLFSAVPTCHAQSAQETGAQYDHLGQLWLCFTKYMCKNMKQTAEHWTVTETEAGCEDEHIQWPDLKSCKLKLMVVTLTHTVSLRLRIRKILKPEGQQHTKTDKGLQRFIKTNYMEGFGMTKWNKIQKEGKEYLSAKIEKRWSKEQDHAHSHAKWEVLLSFQQRQEWTCMQI